MNDLVNFAIAYIKYNKRIHNATRNFLTIAKNNIRFLKYYRRYEGVWLKQPEIRRRIVPANMSASSLPTFGGDGVGNTTTSWRGYSRIWNPFPPARLSRFR